MDTIANLAKKAKLARGAASVSTTTSTSGGTDEDDSEPDAQPGVAAAGAAPSAGAGAGLAAPSAARMLPSELLAAATAADEQDSDVEDPSGAYVVRERELACMAKMAALYRLRVVAGDDCKQAADHVYKDFFPEGARAHNRVTDEVKALLARLIQRVSAAQQRGSDGVVEPPRATRAKAVLEFICASSTCSTKPRWRPALTQSAEVCALCGELADVQFQLDVDKFKAYASYTRRVKKVKDGRPMEFAQWLASEEYAKLQKTFEFFTQRNKIPQVLALVQLAGYMSFSSEMYLTQSAAALFERFNALRYVVDRME